LEDLGDVEFVYHQAGKEIVDPSSYCPDQPKGKAIMRGVTVTMDRKLAEKVEVTLVKESPSNNAPSSGDGAMVVKKQGAAQTETDDGITDEALTFYDPDMDKINKADLAGKFGGMNPSTVLNSFSKKDFLQYGTVKEVMFTTTDKALTPTGDGPALQDVSNEGSTPAVGESSPLAALPKAAGSLGNKKAHRAKLSKKVKDRPFIWGIKVAFETAHGNPCLMARKSYKVSGLLKRYSGEYFAMKVSHVFSDRYVNKVELGG